MESGKGKSPDLPDQAVMRKFFDEARDQLLVVDPATLAVRLANAGATSVFGYSDGELSGLPVARLFSDLNPKILARTVRQLMAGKIDRTEQMALARDRNGAAFRVRLSISLADGEHGSDLLLILSDLSVQDSDAREIRLLQDQLRTAVEALPDGFVLYDSDDRLVMCNRRYKEFYKLSAPAMRPGTAFRDILLYGLERGEYADAIGREEDWLEERMRQHRQSGIGLEQKLSDGRWLRIVERRTPDCGRVGLRIDITDSVRSKARAEMAEQRLSDAISALPAGFWLFDSSDQLVMHNEEVLNTLPNFPEAVEIGTTFEDIMRSNLRSDGMLIEPNARDGWLAERLDERAAGSSEYEVQLSDGRWIKSSCTPTADGGRVGYRIDITKLKQQQANLERAAETDHLTGLWNRRGVANRLREIAEGLGQGKVIAALHVDLDKFKAVNDAHGHDAGDFVLTQVASRLRSGFGDDSIISRFGGDEFLVLRVTDRDISEVIEQSDKVRSDLIKPMNFNGRVCRVGATIGIATWDPAEGYTLEDVLENADIALNSGKRDGRNQSRVYASRMREGMAERSLKADELRDALNIGDIVPYFQPQFGRDGKTLVGFECLARWNHPELGTLGATYFLDAAEEAGLMGEVDLAIIAQGLGALRQLPRHCAELPSISVNISSTQLSDASLVGQIDWLVDAHGLVPEQLRIEILEATLLRERSNQIVDNIRALADRGYPIELDDFGTGHSAIASLRRFPVRRIKVDHSLVRGIDQDESSMIITESIIGLARKLGLDVLAEGVETPEEFQTLRDLGCWGYQGYLFARPMSHSALLEWLPEYKVPELEPVRTSSAI